MKDIITITILALTLAFTLALSSTADAYTPTAEQCRQAGAVFNTATQGCDVGPRHIQAERSVTYTVKAGDTVSFQGTTVYVTSPGTVTFCPCANWE